MGKGSGFGLTRRAFAGDGLRHEAFDAFAVGFQEAAELLNRGQGDEVSGDEEFLIHPGGGEFHGGFVPVAAQEDADRGLVAFLHHVGFEPVDIEIHLPGIGRLEGADFQIDENMTPEQPVNRRRDRRGDASGLR